MDAILLADYFSKFTIAFLIYVYLKEILTKIETNQIIAENIRVKRKYILINFVKRKNDCINSLGLLIFIFARLLNFIVVWLRHFEWNLYSSLQLLLLIFIEAIILVLEDLLEFNHRLLFVFILLFKLLHFTLLLFKIIGISFAQFIRHQTVKKESWNPVVNVLFPFRIVVPKLHKFYPYTIIRSFYPE